MNQVQEMMRNLQHSLHEGFIDRHTDQKGHYKPHLLINQPEKNLSVLEVLSQELEQCSTFLFSVAFITESGLATLKAQLYDLHLKGIKGRILTSTFLSFNQPKMFRELLKLKNVEIRVATVDGFHSKGYIFEQATHFSLIVGSSNLTAAALKHNHEWNVKLTSLENGDLVYHVRNQFEELWGASTKMTEAWVTKYEESYTPPRLTGHKEQVIDFPRDYQLNPLIEAAKITPNRMQEVALASIESVRDQGERRALVISATGTGKTYLSAFDVRKFAPKRMLFIVHREQILKQAKEDYVRVLGGNSNDFGILSGQAKETDCKYLFATIQTLSKKETLETFSPNDFDYILIDEVHKAGAQSYQTVIDYFEPAFLLGMTATPERTDDINIYSLFDYNIAYEIRLQEALEANMLSPFHYFGVSDFEYDGKTISDATLLKNLVTEERINHLIEKVTYYGYSGDHVKGLMFCSRKAEAHRLSDALNGRGFRTVALTSEDDQAVREQRINQLENGQLDYILTVDIFNEGIDIPSINQVVMLRQTKSSIIFIQQLGRGLRKHDEKEFVTIIDFIGNYKNNYLIPVALSGDHSQNKDAIRRHMKNTTYIKGVSTVNFETVARKRIYDAINETNLTTLKILREAFFDLENRIGRTPLLYDFLVQHSVDPSVIVGKYKHYDLFLRKMKKDVAPLTKYESQVLTMLSTEVLNGKRKHEFILLQLLLEQETVTKQAYVEQLTEAGCAIDEKIIASVQAVFDLSFFTDSVQKKYGAKPIISTTNDVYCFNLNIQESIRGNSYFKALFTDILQCAKAKSEKYECQNNLTLHEKYTRKEVCKFLNWDKDESSTMYGYKTKHGTCPIFITYHKAKEALASVQYEDELLNEGMLRWFTRSNRTLKSKEVQKIIHAEKNGITLHIFIKKDDDEGTDFYYLGEANPDQQTVREQSMQNEKGKELPVVTMELKLEHPVGHKLYHYLKAE